MAKPEWQLKYEMEKAKRREWLNSLPEEQVFTDDELNVAEQAVRAVFDFCNVDLFELYPEQKEDVLAALKKSGWNVEKAAKIYRNFTRDDFDHNFTME